jgi:hypothetical protein
MRARRAMRSDTRKDDKGNLPHLPSACQLSRPSRGDVRPALIGLAYIRNDAIMFDGEGTRARLSDAKLTCLEGMLPPLAIADEGPHVRWNIAAVVVKALDLDEITAQLLTQYLTQTTQGFDPKTGVPQATSL